MRAVTLLVALVFVAPVIAGQKTPREIIQESQNRSQSTSFRYEGQLKRFKGGKTIDKKWIYKRIRGFGDSKAVIRFTAPAEVKGVALLIFNHTSKASQQWMWTPAIERDRRIAEQDRSTEFFGTDFSFEDLEERDVDQFDYTLQGSGVVDDVDCWIINATPKTEKISQYSRSDVWVRKVDFATARIDSYVKDQVVRRLNNRNIKNVQGIMTPLEITMANQQKGTWTVLTLEKVVYGIEYKDEDFSLPAIRRPE